MTKLTISPQALKDLDEILDYIARDSVDRAVEFYSRLYEQMDKIAANPGIGRSRNELLPGLRSFPYGNYVFYYLPTTNGAHIVRVLNGARDIGPIFGP